MAGLSLSCTLVLLPGMDGTGELFAPLVRELGASIPTHVVRYPDRAMDYVAHEEFARASLPTDRPFVVLGESFSGPIAVSIAASAPAGLCGYVLCGSFLCSPTPTLKRLGPLAALFSPKVMPKPLAASYLMGRHATPELRRALASALESVSGSALTARLKAIANVDVRADAQRIRLPGLYLRATEDRVVGASASRIFMSHVAKARLVDLEGPHLLLQTKPTESARELRRVLEEWSVR
jgi:pimeloyl-ACP methyl ester carboxylesterase